MLNGCLVAPNVRKPRKDALDISREFPYGGLRNLTDTVHMLYVCHNTVHRDLVAYTFKDRAMYVLSRSMITGRVFDHIVMFDYPWPVDNESIYDAYFRSHLKRGGTVTRYTMEQQFDLGIYKYVGIDFASDAKPKRSGFSDKFLRERKADIDKFGPDILTSGVWPKGS